MIFIDRNAVPVPSVFSSNEVSIVGKRLEEFYSRSEDSRAQERFTIPFTSKLTIQILSALKQLFRGRCAYCESVTGKSLQGVIDNFRPKHNARGIKDDFSRDSYWWLSYDWNNLYYACDSCNRFKSSWFPVDGERSVPGTKYPEINEIEKPLLIDPCYDDPEKHFAYKENGSVDYLSVRGRVTIELLKLNRTELVLEREKILKELKNSFDQVVMLWREGKGNRNDIMREALEWRSVFDSSEKPYLGIQRQFISQWLAGMPDLQRYLTNEAEDYGHVESTAEREDERMRMMIERIKAFDVELPKEVDKELIEDEDRIGNIRHVYIDKIVLQNFRCFDNIVIQFNHSPIVDMEPWLLFLGENGVGKSSILKAIAIAICGEAYIKKLQLSSNDLLMRDKHNGFIHLYLKGEDDFIRVEFNEESIVSSVKHPVANIAAYGATRLLPTSDKIIPEDIHPGGVKAKNLFDYSTSLVEADSWLLELDDDEFQVACLTLKDIMFLNSNEIIVRDIYLKRIFVLRNGKRLYIEDLSDGYKSVYSLVVDIMATFVEDKVTYDVAEGVVLIDEIGTHLHPRWKMEVVSQLRKAFPRIQFIVTTHEPLCLRGLLANEAVVLTKNVDEDIIALTELPDPSELRIDQILTSDFFGLKSTIDPETERLFDEYYKILALDENDRTDEQRDRLHELSEKIPKKKHLGDSLREELVYFVVDELLAKKTRNNGMKITDDLKLEAVKRVSSLWEIIDKNSGLL